MFGLKDIFLRTFCKNDVSPSNVNITRLDGMVDIIKNQNGGQVMLNDSRLAHAVICYSIYH